jgi:Ca2+-binding RTX toxin-like protein
MSMRTGRRIAMAAAIGVACAGATAGTAVASRVENANRINDYEAWAGEVNDLTVEFSTFTDAGAVIRPGHGCTALGDGSVQCPSIWDQTRVFLRDGNDRAHLETISFGGPVTVSGGPGADVIHSGSFNGGVHVIDGGTGPDRLSTALNEGGLSDLRGGPGNDTLSVLEGGGLALKGGDGDDTLFATGNLAGTMDGGPGNDTYSFSGFGGGDLASFPQPSTGFDTLSLADGPVGGTWDLEKCGGCVERVIGSDGADVIQDGAGATQILSGGGDDIVEPRGGADTVQAGTGDDVIVANDGVRDTIDCGDGTDRVVADGNDEFTNCEGAFLPF